MVNESNDSLASLTHPKCRTRDFAVITHKPCLTQFWVDLYIHWLNLNLIVVEESAVGVGDGAMHRSELLI